jgi:YVTN family beta-propeller protein
MRTRKTLLALVSALALVAVSSLPAAAKSTSWTIASTITLPSVVGLALSPDGNTLYAASPTDSTIRVIDTHTFKQLASINVAVSVAHASNPFEIALTLDGSKLYVGDTTNGSATVWQVVVVDTIGRQVANSIGVPGVPRSLNPFTEKTSTLR